MKSFLKVENCMGKYEKQAARIALKHSEELQIVADAVKDKSIITSINEDYAVMIDRVIGVLLNDQLNENVALGQAYILGMLQGERNANRNSDKRTTAHRSI